MGRARIRSAIRAIPIEPCCHSFGERFAVPVADHHTGQVKLITAFMDNALGGSAGAVESGLTNG